MQRITAAVSQKFRNASLLCALMVVVIHCVSHFGVTNTFICTMVYDGVCRSAVPFFFFTSGFFFYAHVGEPGWYLKEIRKRIVTLVVPFVALTLLYWSFHYTTTLSVLAIFGLDVRTWPLLVPLWYIRGLLVLVIISPVLVRCTSIGGMFGLFILYGVVAPWEGVPGEHVFFFRKVIPLQGVFYFTLGMLCRKGTVNILAMPRNLAFAAGALGVGLLVIKSLVLDSLVYCYLGWLAVPFLVAALIRLMPDLNVPSAITSCAFPIYLVHLFLIDAAVVCARKAGIDIGGHTAIWFVVTLAIFVFSFLAVYVQRRLAPMLNKILYGGR